MTKSMHLERETQNRIVKFFQKELGYKYLGNLEDSQNYNVRWGDWERFLADNSYRYSLPSKIALSLVEGVSTAR